MPGNEWNGEAIKNLTKPSLVSRLTESRFFRKGIAPAMIWGMLSFGGFYKKAYANTHSMAMTAMSAARAIQLAQDVAHYQGVNSIDEAVSSAMQTNNDTKSAEKEYVAEEKKEKKKKSALPYILGALGVAAVGGLVAVLTKKKDPIIDPDPIPQYETIEGVITSCDDNSIVSGAAVEFPNITAITDTNGNYSVTVLKGTVNDNSQVKVSKQGFKNYSTYKGHGPDFKVVPNAYDSETFHNVMRGGGISQGYTKRWTQQPKYRIITDENMDANTIAWIKDVLKTNEAEQLSGGFVKGTTNIEESTAMPAANSYYVVFQYIDGLNPNTIASTSINYNPTTYELTRTRVWFNINHRESVSRGTVLHELARAVGHMGSDNKRPMLTGQRALKTDYITRWDIENGKWAYARPSGNQEPDNDMQPTVTAMLAAVNAFSNALFVHPGFSQFNRRDTLADRLQRMATGKADLNTITALLPAVSAEFGNVRLGAANGDIFASVGTENAHVDAYVSNLLSNPDVTASGKFKDGNLLGTADIRFGQNMGLYRLGIGHESKDFALGIIDVYDQQQNTNSFHIALGALPRSRNNPTLESLFGNQRILLTYSNITSPDSTLNQLNASANIGNFVLGGSVGMQHSEQLQNPLTQVGLNAYYTFNQFMIGGSYSKVNAENPIEQFMAQVMGRLGPALLSGSYRSMRSNGMSFNSADFSAALPIKISGLNLGNIMVNYMYEPNLAKQFGLDKGLSIRYIVMIPIKETVH